MAVLFLGLAKNCESTLPSFCDYIALLNRSGVAAFALIGENGSWDRSRELISQAAAVELVDTSFLNDEPRRLTRMAKGRQALLERARGRGAIDEFICVVDVDNVMKTPPSVSELEAAMELLRNDSSLFAVGATSTPYYYDLLSLRTEGHDYDDLHNELEEAKKRPFSYYEFHRRRIYPNQRKMSQPVSIPCVSSFNGLCLYRGSDYVRGSYRSLAESVVCEHVTLNQAIHRTTGCHMLIDPHLTVAMPSDHGPVGFLTFWKDRVFKRLRNSN